MKKYVSESIKTEHGVGNACAWEKVIGSFLITVFLVVIPSISFAVDSNIEHWFSIGSRLHTEHSQFDSLPFGNGDLTYLAAYEYHDVAGFWQLGIGYTPDPSGDNSGNYVITPQLSLILKNWVWRFGIGTLKSYIVSDNGDDWLDLYWQFNLGMCIPLSHRINLNLNSYYVFEKWGKINEFGAQDVEFGAAISFKF